MEIEAKLPLSPARAEALRQRLGKPDAIRDQRDVYLQTAGLPVALRVRVDGPDAWVTLKSGFEEVGGIRVREEIEPAIKPEEADQWLTIFRKLGLPPGLAVEKTRESYRFDGDVQVVLDTVTDLGTFVEVEAIADEAPAAIARLEHAIAALGLGDLPRVTDSYRELLARKQRGG